MGEKKTVCNITIVVYVKDSYVILYCGVLKDVCTTE